MAGLPAGIPKTGETRAQSAPGVVEELAGYPYYITTKLDGTSVTMLRIDGRFGVCGHNFEYADDGKCSFWAWARNNDLEQRLIDAGLDNIAIQGEFCGAGIQRNPLKLERPGWFVFTVHDVAAGRRCGLAETRELCEKLGLEMVPVEEEGEAFAYASVDELLERARGKYACGSIKEASSCGRSSPCTPRSSRRRCPSRSSTTITCSRRRGSQRVLNFRPCGFADSESAAGQEGDAPWSTTSGF